MSSDPANPDIYRLDGYRLIRTIEQLIPEKADHRPPLLLVLGNPATHSVKAGMFFSFEDAGREHRFWKSILRPSGVLDIPIDEDLKVEERNARRRERILAPSRNTNLTLRFLTVGGHFNNFRIEPSENLDKIGLSRHDLIDVFVSHGHFIESTGDQIYSLLLEEFLGLLPCKTIFGFGSAHQPASSM